MDPQGLAEKWNKTPQNGFKVNEIDTNIWTKKCYLDIFQFIQPKFENIKMDPHRFLGP